jgi:hypothetical protein
MRRADPLIDLYAKVASHHLPSSFIHFDNLLTARSISLRMMNSCDPPQHLIMSLA